MNKRTIFVTLFSVFFLIFGMSGSGFAQTSTDNFERATLDGNWSAHPNLGIYNSSNLHNNSADDPAWVLGVYDASAVVTNPDEFSLTWAGSSDGCNADGVQQGGIAIVNSDVYSEADGYLVQYRLPNKIRLWYLLDGALDGTRTFKEAVVTNPTTPIPGSIFKVKFNNAAHTFQVFVNDVSVGTLTDNTAAYSFSSWYGGIVLVGTSDVFNDVEDFTVAIAEADVTAPNAVTDLDATTLGSTSIRLDWTAPGNDGTVGTASSYDIRYSTSAITDDAAFTAATSVNGEPVPQLSGDAETFTVTGLSPNTTYYFALKSSDGTNISALSNSPDATTDEGEAPLPGMVTVVDNFERETIGTSWAVTTRHEILSGTLGIIDGTSTDWDNNLAVYKGNRAVSPAGVAIRLDDIYCDASGAMAVGIALLLDSPTTNANGYFILRRNASLELWDMANGQVGPGGRISRDVSPNQSNPVPGDVIKVMITSEESDAATTVDVYINDLLDGSLTIEEAEPEDWYAGVFQHGSFNNNIEDFIIYSDGSAAELLNKYYGDNQSGLINTTLPDSIAVQVTDALMVPVAGTVVNFDLVSGEADLSINDFDYGGLIWKEVEDGTIISPAVTQTDANASNNTFMVTPPEFVTDHNATPGVNGGSILTLYVPENGNFSFWVRVICPTIDGGNKDTYHYQFDDQEPVFYKFSSLTSTWKWVKIINVNFTKGFHKIYIYTREGGLRFDKILLGNNITKPSYTPSGTGGTTPTLPNITNANGIAHTFVTFKNNANDNVVINATAFSDNGIDQLTGSPVVFTLDPTPGPAVKIMRDPAQPDTLMGEPIRQMTTPLRALVKDQYNNLVPGIVVNWAIAEGSTGTLSNAQSTTNEQGAAETYLTLSAQNTVYTIQATATGLTGSPVNFYVEPGDPPTQIVKVSPTDPLTGDAGVALTEFLTVQVKTEDDSPFEGFPVNFVVTQGGGNLSTQLGDEHVEELIVSSDANGYARVEWVLGTVPGDNKVEARAEGLAGTPILFEATGQIGAPDTLIILSGNNQTGPLGLALQEPFLVKVLDQVGNAVPNKDVEFRIIQGSGAYLGQAGITVRVSKTNSQGIATDSLTIGNQVGQVHQVQVKLSNYAAIPAVIFYATATDAIASELVYVSGNGVKVGTAWQYQSAVVNTTLNQAFTVQVNGPFGNDPIVGHPVKFTVKSGGGSFFGSTETTVSTGADGRASATLTLGSLAGDSVHVVEASAYRVDYPSQTLRNSPVTFKAKGMPADPAIILKNNAASDNQSGIVGNSLAKAIEAKVTDLYGNPIPGHTVTFDIINNGGTLQGQTGSPDLSKQATTNVNGIASIIWIMPSIPGQVQMTARATTLGGSTLTNSPLYYTAYAGVDVANEMIRVSSATVTGTVGKVLTDKLVVMIVDRYQNPVSGYPVTFTVKKGGGLVNGSAQATIQTASDGTAEVEWTLGSVMGYENNQVEATSSVSVNPKVNFVASGVSDVAFRVIPDTTFDSYGIVGEFLATPIRVQIVDQYGNPVSGQDVLFEIEELNENQGYVDTLGTLSKTRATDADGYAQIRWGLGPNPGSMNNKLIVISKRGGVHLINSPYDGFIVSAQAGVASKLVKITDDTSKDLSSVIGSTLAEYLRVKVTDRFGTPIARHKVTFRVTSRAAANGGTLDGVVDTIKVKETDSNGIAFVQLNLGLNAGVKINKVQYSADYNGTPLSGSPGIFQVSGLSSNAVSIVKLDGDNQDDGVVGQFWGRALQVAAKDANQNNVAGQPITFRIMPKDTLEGEELGALGVGTAIDTTVNTGADGIARIQWRAGHLVGNYQVQVTSFAAYELAGSPMTFTAIAQADSTNQDKSTIAVNPAALKVSDGSIKATITVTLRDRFGNPVQKKGVTISASGTGNTITQPVTSTNDNGQVSGYISSYNSGVKMLSARDINNEVDLLNKAQVTFQAAEAQRVIKFADSGDGQERNIGTVLEKPLQVMVVDNFNNPIPNFPVNFTVTEDQTGGRIVDNSTINSDENGIASRYYRLGTVSGINLIEVNGQGLTATSVKFSVEGNMPVDLQKPRIVSGDSLSAGPGQALPQALVIIIEDERGWPVWNQEVEFKALGANNGAVTSSNPHVTDWYGMARANAQVGTKVGINLFNSTLKRYPEKGSTTFYAWTVSATNAKFLSFVSGPVNGTVGQALGQPFIMKTTDEYDNPVGGINVTFTVINDESVNGAGTLEGGVKVLTKTTNQQGQVSVFYTLGIVSGLNKIRASALNLSPSSFEISVTGLADSPYRMDKFSGDKQRMEMSKQLFDPLFVKVSDRHGNPAPGGVVTFTVTQGDGYINGEQSVQSNDNGLAKAYWVLGPRPYAVENKLQVTSSFLIGGPITFEATGDDQHYPEFQNLSDQVDVFETSTLIIPIRATDADGERIYYTARNLPAGSTFEADSDQNYSFRWTPGLDVVNSPDLSKTFYPVFIATDNHDPAGKVKDSVQVVVKNYNRTPVITSYWPQDYQIKFDAAQNQPIQFGVVTNDLDGDPVTVQWYVDGFQKAEGHTFTLQPSSYPQNRPYPVTVKVCDLLTCSERNWELDPTSVELSNFSASVIPYKGILIEWQTSNEVGNAGFNLLRCLTENGTFVKINETLIPPASDRKYSVTDPDLKAGHTYYYRLEDVSVTGVRTHHGPISAVAPIPSKFDLSQNYPNPFNPTTTIRFEMPKTADVTLEVYNIMGQLVRQLINDKVEAGYHTVLWDGANASGLRVVSGVYYYRFVSGDYVNIKKMVLLK